MLLYLFACTLLLEFARADVGNIKGNRTNTKNDLLNWQPPENFKTKFAYYNYGHDFENRPVMVFQWGKWYTRTVVERGGQDFEDLKKLQDLTVERIRTAFFTKPMNDSDNGMLDTEVVIIGDMEGYDLAQFASTRNIKYIIEYLSKFQKVNDKIAYGFLINVAAVSKQFVNLMRVFMANIFERVEVYGTNSKVWIPRLLRKIPRDQLPPKYGGVRLPSQLESPEQN